MTHPDITATPDLPAISAADLTPIDPAFLTAPDDDHHAPRIAILTGSLRERSYSRLAAQEGGRILKALGADVRFFDPRDADLAQQIQSQMAEAGAQSNVYSFAHYAPVPGLIEIWVSG